MSFYDLTADFVLSAKDLFKYRGKRNRTLPSRGGQKDFEPDNSWMQTKALEKFMEERTSLLSEPRVEKLRNLVEGTWDGDKRLINVKKTGKFWTHMGFTDKRRNWLYPEEALFLMECNTLEVYHAGVPLSIQEAYNMFLGSDVNIEEYQVFSHLRRLGFVVLRHEDQPIITPYERQINLDKYISKKSRKERVIKAGKQNKTLQQSVQVNGATSNHQATAASNPTFAASALDVNNALSVPSSKDETVALSNQVSHVSEDTLLQACLKTSNMEVDETGLACLATETEKSSEQSNNLLHEFSVESRQTKRPGSPIIDSSQENAKRSCSGETCVVRNSDSTKNATEPGTLLDQDNAIRLARGFYGSSWSSCFIKAEVQTSVSHMSNNSVIKSDDSQVESSINNSGVKILPFPNIANTDLVSLQTPDSYLLPENVNLFDEKELQSYDVRRYHIMNPPREMSKQVQREEEEETRIKGLQFSFPEWINRKSKLTVASWKEFKQKLAENIKDMSHTTPVDHLWKGKVTPLVHPGENWTYQSILDKLSIIQPAENDSLLTDSDCMVDVKVTFDVHLPDSRFKKSMPGVPNHRVSVCKCSSDLPGLAELHQVWSRFKDDVPLHWAVVDSGEIAFYMFDGSHSSSPFL